MIIGIYTRIFPSDENQVLEDQLRSLRECARTRGWEIYREYMDRTPASGLIDSAVGKQLLVDAGKHRFDLVLVPGTLQAFTSVLDLANSLERLRALGVGLRSYADPWLDTTSPHGEVLFNLTATFAQLEKRVLGGRLEPGIDGDRIRGPKPGRPSVWTRDDFPRRFGAVLERLDGGDVSRRQAARELGIGYATLKRLLDARAADDGEEAGY